jgi:pimeloyl-ACP methyl ester carboxylesterase
MLKRVGCWPRSWTPAGSAPWWKIPQREALRQGPWGFAWGTAASLAPWGFALEDIDIEFHLWHGGKDPIERQEDVDHWAGRIPRARVRTWEESGHFVVVEQWREILADVLS